jgi:hypothetical protein
MNPKKPQKIQANKSQKPIPKAQEIQEKNIFLKKKKNSEINTNKISRSRRLREK